jgi:hypothetical protein
MSYHPDLNTVHLTSDQIDDHLIGDLAPTPAEHLAACPLCADRVAAAALPFATFQQVSTAWSERRSATLPIPIPSERPALWQRNMAWASATLSIALGFAFMNASHQFSLLNAAPPAAAASPAIAQTAPLPPPVTIAAVPRLTETASLPPSPRAARISADNHMLQAINASLAPATDSPAALGLPPIAAPTPGPLALQD